MYSNWYSCLHFPDTTTLSLIAVTYSRIFHPFYMVQHCPLPHFPPLLSGATFSTPRFQSPRSRQLHRRFHIISRFWWFMWTNNHFTNILAFVHSCHCRCNLYKHTHTGLYLGMVYITSNTHTCTRYELLKNSGIKMNIWHVNLLQGAPDISGKPVKWPLK